MSRIYSIWSFLRHYKYHVVIVVSVLIIGFLDENSFWNRYQHQREINSLKEEIRKYTNIYKSDTFQIKQLDHNPKSIEKIARERYFMKADDEDIFILSDDEKQTSNNETSE